MTGNTTTKTARPVLTALCKALDPDTVLKHDSATKQTTIDHIGSDHENNVRAGDFLEQAETNFKTAVKTFYAPRKGGAFEFIATLAESGVAATAAGIGLSRAMWQISQGMVHAAIHAAHKISAENRK